MEEHVSCANKSFFPSLLLALVLGGSFVVGKYVETRDAEPTVVSVTGEGRLFGVPDIAEVNFGVNTGRHKTAERAMATLKEKMSAVFEAVKSQGVEEKDIRTQYLSLNPAYDWMEGKRIDRGFEASQSLRVKVRDLDTISAVLQSAVSQGANQAGGVTFTIDDPDVLRAKARKDAITDAEAKAKILAGQLGQSLGRIKGFSEGGGGYPPMPMMARGGMMMESMAMDKALPIPAGEQEIVVNVTISYELK